MRCFHKWSDGVCRKCGEVCVHVSFYRNETGKKTYPCMTGDMPDECLSDGCANYYGDGCPFLVIETVKVCSTCGMVMDE